MTGLFVSLHSCRLACLLFLCGLEGKSEGLIWILCIFLLSISLFFLRMLLCYFLLRRDDFLGTMSLSIDDDTFTMSSGDFFHFSNFLLILGFSLFFLPHLLLLLSHLCFVIVRTSRSNLSFSKPSQQRRFIFFLVFLLFMSCLW